jgi:hypothetical protein
MHRARRTLSILLSVAVVSLAAACTKSDTSPTPSESGASATASGQGPVTTNEDVTFVPGAYRYSFNNLTATLTLKGSAATLDVKNGSGGDVGAPSIYVITRDDQRYDAKIAAAAGIPDGSEATFEVTFPSQVTEKTAGLIVLSLGGDNYGAFAPVAAPSPSGSPSP